MTVGHGYVQESNDARAHWHGALQSVSVLEANGSKPAGYGKCDDAQWIIKCQ